MAEKKQNSKIEFYTEYTVKNAIKNGDKYTKLSMFILGAGNFARKEFVKGVLFLLSAVSYTHLTLPTSDLV